MVVYGGRIQKLGSVVHAEIFGSEAGHTCEALEGFFFRSCFLFSQLGPSGLLFVSPPLVCLTDL